MNKFEPLDFPDPWPAPDEPPPTEKELEWMQIPLLGWFISVYLNRRRFINHVNNVLCPIEKQIVDQLIARPKVDGWPNDPLYQEIANLISKAIADEKVIDPPSIHPDDLYCLLFWGAYDDLTPLNFQMGFEKRFGVRLPKETVIAFFRDDCLASEVIDRCVESLKIKNLAQ